MKAYLLYQKPDIPVLPATIDLAGVLLNTGEKEKALDILNRAATQLVDAYQKTLAVRTLFDKDSAVYYIRLITDLLKTNQLSSKIVERFAKTFDLAD